ncbi:MAG TPA: hypothetical protein VGB70_06685 [Allosphingosinicella sp.]|jgi:hypothetical protein
MTPDKIKLLPDWPARMGADLAALYLGVSGTTFRERVKQLTYPQPVREGGRQLWSHRQLDPFVDAQFEFADNARDTSWDDLLSTPPAV